MPARRLKYCAVVSLRLIAGCHSATAATAFDRCAIALVWSGTDPWPATPRATRSIPFGTFSVV